MAKKPDPRSDLFHLEEEDQDVLFRVQMQVASLFLGYWKHALAILGVALTGTLIYGLIDGHLTETRRATHAAVARTMVVLEQTMTNAELDETEREDAARALAADLEKVAAEASGPAAAWAWVQVGRVWEAIEQTESAAAAWEQADQAGATGILGWAAAAGHAHALAQAGDVDSAGVIYRDFADQAEGVVAEEALFTLGTLYLEAERFDDGAKAFEEFGNRFPDSELSPRAAAALKLARES